MVCTKSDLTLGLLVLHFWTGQFTEGWLRGFERNMA